MTLRSKICRLQQRVWLGDVSAGDELKRLLMRYIALISRRESRRLEPGSPVAKGIQRLIRQRNDRPESLPEAADVCRQLFDELLNPAARNDRVDILDTVRLASRTQRRQ